MEDQQKIDLFEKLPVPRAVMKLAVPTILSSLVMVLYNLADTYFVGMLNDPIQNAGVALAAPVLLAFNAINNLFGVGSSSMMSRALGRRDYETVYKSSAFGFYSSILCGLLFSLLCTVFAGPLLGLLGADETTYDATMGYMFWTVNLGAMPAILNVVMAYLVRAEGASLHASLGTMSGCLLNIVLDPIFILPWGFDMGAAGAGLATFLSNCVACLYFFVLLYVKRGRTYVSIHPKMYRWKKEIVLGVFGVGVPASIQNLLNVTGMTVLNNFTAAYGANAVAAMGIAQKINQVPMQISMAFSQSYVTVLGIYYKLQTFLYLPANGIVQGMRPLISYNYASRNVSRMKGTLLFTVKIALSFMVVVALGYFFFAGPLTEMFMSNPDVVSYGAAFLRGFCLGLPFLCMDFIAVGVFQATGLGRNALIFAILRKIVLEIPALFVLNWLFPLYGLAYAQFTAEILLAVAAVLVLRRLFRDLERGHAPAGA